MLDRSIPPSYIDIKEFHLPKINRYTLSNGAIIRSLSTTDIPIFKLELVIRAGSAFGQHEASSLLLSQLIFSGTSQFTSSEITKKFELLGAYVESSQSIEWFTIRLYGLKENFKHSIELLSQVLQDFKLFENEFTLLQSKLAQAYAISQQKTEVLASKSFKKQIFGKDSRFCSDINLEKLNSISTDDIEEFYTAYIKNKRLDLSLAGNFKEQDLEFAVNALLIGRSEHQSQLLPVFKESIATLENVQLENSVQASINIGKVLVGRNHPDYPIYMLTNTLLGGYFGSRLMKNIREEKGLTYGISSGATLIGNQWLWCISSDVKKENIHIIQQEIFREIDVLQNETIEDEEIHKVKNYIIGSLLSSTNTIFDVMDKHRILDQEKLDSHFYENLVKSLHAVNTSQIQKFAQKYFKDFMTSIAGA
ncbi:MAG: M16 family metallopeptidase [Leadbetterella sp.]